MVTRIQRTQGTGTSTKKFTFSGWIKKASNTTSNDQVVFESNNDANNRITTYFRGSTNNTFNIYGALSGSTIINIETTRLFRDISAWYHIVVAVDTTQGTAADRVKIYVNGTQETAFNYTSTYPSQDANLPIGSSSYVNTVGYYAHGGSSAFDGCMSHLHFIDGTAYSASTFGSTDAATGEWSIKTAPSVSYGNNGFFILKDGNSVTDQSGNGNNLTVATGTLTKTEDCPSNVFATLNPLFGAGGQFPTMSNGNTTSYTTNLGVAGTSTLGASSGKYYAEFKHSACTSGGSSEGAIGICDTYFINSNSNLGGSSSSGYQEYSIANWGLRNTNGRFFYSSGGSKYTADNQHAGWSLGNIIMLALDCDNNRLYFGKNGQWSSSNTWSSSTPSQYITIDPTNFEGNYHFACGDSSGANISTWQCNFGNGYFGTTAVSSAGTNASGIGIFEYDVPTGYTALSTKGLNL